MNRETIFFDKESGEIPVRDFHGNLDFSLTKKILWTLQVIKEAPIAPSLYFKTLKDSDGIRKARIFWEEEMNLENYSNKRTQKENISKDDFWDGYNNFKIGVFLKEARIKSGLTQEDLAKRNHTTKSVISRMENHSEDIKLSTIEKVAAALGKELKIAII